MKTISTFKNRLTPHLLNLSVMFLLISVPAMSQVKHVVNVSDFKFTPKELQISVGDTVEWQNTQGYHNVNGTIVTFPLNPESFGNSAGMNWTYAHVFKTIGFYDYHCDPHALDGMTGKIEVKQSTGNNDKYNLTINFMGMTPHVDQILWLEVVDKNSEKEVERKKQIVSTDFSVDVSGIEKDHSYFVNFYADHNGNGSYDTPPVDHAWQLELNDVMGDTTLIFQHNTNFTDIMWENKLTVHFMNMTPHVGQTMKLAVTDKNTGMELSRVTSIASVDFMVDIYGIENGNSYNIDFYADHNGNGAYDVPPTDHAWRLELNDVANDTVLNFTHNTSFTDIQWKNELAVHFMGMTPHVGQNLTLWIIDRETGMAVDSVMAVAQTEFMIYSQSLLTGKSYNIDFYADHNGNGSYDAPPTDHAWRIKLDDVKGDTMLVFMHNTSFTDIMAKNMLMVHFMGMNPHVGQNLHLAVTDKNSGMEIERVSVVASVDFMVQVSGIELGKSYNIDFFADHNGNGQYDAPPADHAWRLELNSVMGDTTLVFQHNTSFTDIMWKNKLTVHFMGMNPHIGQNLHLAVIDKNSGMEVQRVTTVATVDFMVDVYGIENGMSYNVDFYADHNRNGMYDAPPADHAWRLELNDVMGDTTLNFQHNTSFTDIMWKNKLMVHFMGMNPHVGQNLQLAVIEKTSGMEVQRVSVTASVDFWVSVYGIENGMSYNVDFYADHNSNGMYDAPPVDHAWRLELNDVMGDTTLNFQHNTSFTDINWISTAISELNNSSFKMYPNPATGRVFIESNEFNSTVVKVMIYDISGKLKLSKIHSPEQILEIDIHALVNGMYFVELSNENKRKMMKLIKY
jgi:plastocyanin